MAPIEWFIELFIAIGSKFIFSSAVLVVTQWHHNGHWSSCCSLCTSRPITPSTSSWTWTLETSLAESPATATRHFMVHRRQVKHLIVCVAFILTFCNIFTGPDYERQYSTDDYDDLSNEAWQRKHPMGTLLWNSLIKLKWLSLYWQLFPGGLAQNTKPKS